MAYSSIMFMTNEENNNEKEKGWKKLEQKEIKEEEVEFGISQDNQSILIFLGFLLIWLLLLGQILYLLKKRAYNLRTKF